MVTITAFPRSLLVDEKISIKVVGLRPNSSVTLRASVTDCGKTYDSCAHFQTDSTGHVAPNEHPSLGGTYSGVQGMGLFTSMLPSPKEKRGSRLLKKDISTPLVNELIVYDGFHTVKEFYKSPPKVLAKTNVERWYISKDVERIPIRSGNIRGVLFKPKGRGPFPGVIDMFGAVGRLVQFRSALLASHGFASLALPYFNYKDLTPSIAFVTMDYFVEAVDWFLEQPCIDKSGIGLIGVCVGGQNAIKLSVLCGRKIKACVSINGCPFDVIDHPSRRYKQTEYPSAQVYPDKIEIHDGTLQLLKYFPTSLTEEDRDAMMPLEKSECEFLFISGDDDQCWPGSAYAKLAADYLTSKGKTNWQVLSYPGAGHLIEPPYSPLCTEVFMHFLNTVSVYGGHHDSHAIAQEDSWRKALAFLHKYIGKRVPARKTAPSIMALPLNSKL